ncbi:uncharacterized protein LOC117331105 [Pecten maximus]|uniref:uncharacterized protein LOC117331105 n=1 Tax=Pecten maximus TaxID=6579 RepID=UPI0014586601|nr:uncharacterized protein LOC117331105 [Pecten maximus]
MNTNISISSDNYNCTGKGLTINDIGLGGSYGGEGGAENENHSPATGYGFFNSPSEYGSSGGTGLNSAGSTVAGGCGGGILKFHLSSKIQIDGDLTANGQLADSTYAGGGSGGSIFINTTAFDGTGKIEVNGGAARNGGGGGRVAIIYEDDYYIGDITSTGGLGDGEIGASGTVYKRDMVTSSGAEFKHLQVYNQQGNGDSKSRISISEVQTPEQELDLLDLGQYAQVGFLAVDSAGMPVVGERTQNLTQVGGDHTAVVHIEPGYKLNIVFNDSAILSFDVHLYENATVNLPYETFLLDCRVILYGGVLQGVEKLNISMDGSFTIYPPAQLGYSQKVVLNSIDILDGGFFNFQGNAENDSLIEIILDGGFHVHGGGEMQANNLVLRAVNITVDADGLVNSSGRGYDAGQGPAAGVYSQTGGSGASHGGLGGIGAGTSYANSAIGDMTRPVNYGSGGSAGSGRASGGGIIHLRAEHLMEIDGSVTANGMDAESGSQGSGAGGSILLEALHFLGTGTISANGGGGGVVPNCNSYDSERRCLQCNSGYFWVQYNCVSDCQSQNSRCCESSTFVTNCVSGGNSRSACSANGENCQSGFSLGSNTTFLDYCGDIGRTCAGETNVLPLKFGGGAGGGRMAVLANDSYSFRGNYETFGGNSGKENGGSGTVYLRQPDSSGGYQDTLRIDNDGSKPLNTFISNPDQDSGKTYVTMASTTNTELYIHNVQIYGSAHLVFKNTTQDGSIPVQIGHLTGDKTGMLHSLADIPEIKVNDSDSPFPSSFAIYENAALVLPSEVHLIRLEYTTIKLDGTISGAGNFHIGQGVNVLVGEHGKTSGSADREFHFDTLQVYADGKMSSDFINEYIPSLVLNVTGLVRLHAGGRIEAPWLEITADQVQLDPAGVIDTTLRNVKTAMDSQDGINAPTGGGSGGGGGASGGQGTNQTVVGASPSYGDMYFPKEFGGTGGDGGGSNLNLGCTPNETHTGGNGGGIVQMTITRDLVLDGEILCKGSPGSGPRGGGGGGGSILIKTNQMTGTGLLSVEGGSVASGTNTCHGGGGGGGRIAIHYNNTLNYNGETHSHGGSGGLECGGAGTVLLRDTFTESDILRIDNKAVCTPLDDSIDFSVLSDTRRGEVSCQTWLFDPTSPVSHTHNFSEVSLKGKAQLAVYRRNIDSFNQYVTINKGSGDKTGTFHVGNLQVFSATLHVDSPELDFGLKIYQGGTMKAEEVLLVQGITIEFQGTLEGAEHLIIGPGGRIILKPYTNTSVATTVTNEITFTSITIQGGGVLEINSEAQGMVLIGNTFHVESRGLLDADKIELRVANLIVDDSATIRTDTKAPIGVDGDGVGRDSSGAGHGGMGGTGTIGSAGGLFYGALKMPQSFGSSGVTNTSTQTYGGGVIKIEASNYTTIDGRS